MPTLVSGQAQQIFLGLASFKEGVCSVGFVSSVFEVMELLLRKVRDAESTRLVIDYPSHPSLKLSLRNERHDD